MPGRKVAAMIISEARIAANRRNALNSSGPKTEAGKARSRANALTHGLTSTIVPHPENDCQIVQARARDWAESFGSQEGFEGWVADQVAGLTWKIDRAERIEVELRGKHVARAGVCWDDDRRLEVEVLAAKLAKTPPEVVERLKRTAHGCDWLIHRWAMLGHIAEMRRPWTDPQRTLAFNLLGTPLEFRDRCEPGERIDLDNSNNNLASTLARPLDLARSQIEALKARRDELEELDELDHAMACADLADESSPELRRLRRYQGALQRQLRWSLAHIENQPTTTTKTPTVYIPAPQPIHASEPEPKPEPQLPASPVQNEPIRQNELTRQNEPIPPGEAQVQAVSDRHIKREARVEARREAAQRKLARLLA